MRPGRILILLLMAIPLQAKTLRYRSVEVSGSIDAAGTLHAREKQVLTFTGDWNGGERFFRVTPGHEFNIVRVARIDSEGHEKPLTAGTLALVDQYKLFDGSLGPTLRWRARTPDDPPFNKKKLSYVIEYTETKVISSLNGRDFELNHDFAFAQRPSPIDLYTLHITYDPVWGAKPIVEIRKNLAPGDGVVIRATLTQTGAAAAVASPRTPINSATQPPQRTEPATADHIFDFFVIALIALVAYAFLRERLRGRFGGGIGPQQIGTAWLTEHIFTMPAEVAGAAWDRKVGSSEVVAMLARMEQEGKLSSTADPGGMKLKLLEPFEELPLHEQSLVRALFAGKTETDTTQIRDSYRASGFDPASVIRGSIEAQLAHIPGWSETQKSYRWISSVMAMVLGIFLAIHFGVQGLDIAIGLSTMFFVAVPTFVAWLVARSIRKAQSGLAWRIVLLLILLLFPLLVLRWLTSAGLGSGVTPGTLVGVAIFALGACKFALDAAASRETKEALELRNNLFAARAYFAQQLGTREPQLDDLWYPYIVAFGLGKEVERWFESFRPLVVRQTVQTYNSGPDVVVIDNTRNFTGSGWNDRPWHRSGYRSSPQSSSASWLSSSPSTSSSSSSGDDDDSSSSSSSSSSSGYTSSSDSGSSSSGGGGGGGW